MPYKDPEVKRRYERERAARLRAEFLASRGNQCAECGSDDRLEVDHIDPALKVSHRIWTWSAARREAELVKCQLLCVNCHRNKSAYAREAPHGTMGRYSSKKWRCRCDACREAATTWHRNYRQSVSQ